MGPLLERLVRFVLELTIVAYAPPHAPSAAPYGFEPADVYSDMSEACMEEAKLLAPGWTAVWEWCAHRTHHSSRGNVIHSDVDGSWIHDRDRNVAWYWYGRALFKGRLDPASCEYHRVKKGVAHTGVERKWKREWPWKRKPSQFMLSGWWKETHDVERFGTRGPHDHNYAAAQRLMAGCWDPAALDRYDVAARLTVLKAVNICEVHGCRNKWGIRRHW